MSLSDAHRLTLARALGLPLETDEPTVYQQPQAAAPTLVVKRESALDDVEALVDDWDSPEAERRRPNTWLARQRHRGGLAQADTRLTLNGRQCCLDLYHRLYPRLHMLRLPYEETCRCGTVYAVELRVRT